MFPRSFFALADYPPAYFSQTLALGGGYFAFTCYAGNFYAPVYFSTSR